MHETGPTLRCQAPTRTPLECRKGGLDEDSKVSTRRDADRCIRDGAAYYAPHRHPIQALRMETFSTVMDLHHEVYPVV
jgi:hypothetical protein